HVLGHEAKLWDAIGVKLFLVAEGHWFKCQNGFARFVHRFGLRLETLRRDDRAKLAVGPNDDSYPCRHNRAADAGNVGGPVGLARADADYPVFIGAKASIADVDIVIARSQVQTRT